MQPLPAQRTLKGRRPAVASLASLIPLVLFLLVALAASIVVRRRADAAGGGFVNSYFIGNRALGGFVLAMTTIATYGSVSSFVGGPGQAWQIGFGWVYMAVVQVTALVLLYGIFGKKMALISRKLDAVTVVDVIRARYGSNALANLSALVIVLFFAATMVAQFVGGAKLFEAVTGYSYLVGLALFGVAVILFTTIGGFRGVAVTDTLCGIMMLVGIVVLAGGILTAGGGYEALMTSIKETSPEMLEPFAGGAMPPSLYFTQWLLVGVFTFVLPQSVVRTMGYKDVKSLHRAMIWGTVIIGAMMIGVTSLGVLTAGVLTEDLAAYGGSVDNIIPTVITASLPPALAGIAIIRTCGRVHFHGVIAAHLVVLGHHQGRLSALVRRPRAHALPALRRPFQPGGDAGGGPARVRALHRAAGCHLEDQHVRFRRSGDGVSVRACLRVVLEAGQRHGRSALARRRHVGLLRRHGRGLQSGRFAPDRHRRGGGRRPHGGGNARWQAERRRPHGRLLPDGLEPRSVNTARPDPFRDPGALLL